MAATHVIYMLVFMQMFRYLDSKLQGKVAKPYYAVHVIHNIAMIALTIPDVWFSFTGASAKPPNYLAASMCQALHFYHIINYYSVLRYDDWLHHGLMVGIALPLGGVIPAGPLLGSNLFFTTGLPGAISYSLLFAERNRLLDRATVQKYNALTHLWLRAPGCVAQATLAFVFAITSSEVTRWQRMAGILISCLTAWNGMYFMEQAIRTRSVSTVTANNKPTGDERSPPSHEQHDSPQ